MLAPIHKDLLMVGGATQYVPGRVLSAGPDGEGNPAVWYLADGTTSRVVTLPTGGNADAAWDHLATFVWESLVVHAFAAR